jgi:hypothetical protein
MMMMMMLMMIFIVKYLAFFFDLAGKRKLHTDNRYYKES